MVKEFDGLEYTRESLLEELSLIERHARDGSAYEAGCSCIEEKHLLLVSGLASEGVTLAKDLDEKIYYMNLADLARAKRLEILNAEWKTPEKHEASFACEKKIEKCILQGHTELQCLLKYPCP